MIINKNLMRSVIVVSIFAFALPALATFIVITTTSLSDVTIGAPYSQTLTASGGAPNPTWSIVSGSGDLPTGLQLNPNTGEIYGTSTLSGTFTFVVQIQDVNLQSDTKTLSLVVNPAPSITTTSLPIGTANGVYPQTLQVSGGSGTLTWSILSGSGNLPNGLNLDSGLISGSPATIGTYNFTVQVTDANGVSATQSFSITIVTAQANYYPDPPYTYTPSAYDAGVSRTPESGPFYVGQGFTFGCSWNTRVFKVPEYVQVAGCSGDTVNFIPTEPGSYMVTVNPYNAFGPYGRVKFYFDVVVPQINTSSLADGFVGAIYSQILSASGAAPLMWNSDDLPQNGLSLNPLTGEISGTPIAVGIYNLIFQIKDQNHQIATKTLSLTVHGNTPVGSNIQVTSGNTTSTFTNITQEGQTTVTQSSSGSQPPSGFKLGNPPTYYSISTTALFTGSIEICLGWTQGQFNNENNLKLFHYNGTNWTNITEAGYPDTVNNVICGLTTSFSDFAIFEKKQVTATIDIKPGSFPNSINLGSNGTVPVAIFSTAEFDATTIDPLSVSLASAPVKLKGNGTAMYSFQDVNSDGLLDMIVHVSTEALQLSSTDQVANFVGYTSDSTEVLGSDTVRVIQ